MMSKLKKFRATKHRLNSVERKSIAQFIFDNRAHYITYDLISKSLNIEIDYVKKTRANLVAAYGWSFTKGKTGFKLLDISLKPSIAVRKTRENRTKNAPRKWITGLVTYSKEMQLINSVFN